MLMNRPEKIEQNKKKKTPTPVISGYTKEEMEEIYSFAQSKIGEKPSAELSEQPRIDFKINETRARNDNIIKELTIFNVSNDI